jgi:modulator of FtsH protease HflC
MRRTLLVILALILLVVLARACTFAVDRTEFVYLTQFGRYVATYDGADEEQAGLHFRWPWPVQSVLRVDRRLQVLDLPAAELVTEDPREGGTVDKTLAIDAYVVWRVPNADAVERFILTVGTPERAREILRDRIRGRLGAAIARMQMDDLVSDREGWVDQQREQLRQKLLQPYEGPADGMEIVDIRVRRLNYPAQVRQAIFDRIRSERQRKVAYHESLGDTEARNISSTSAAEAKIKLDEARAQAREKRGQADAQADRILNRAISRDPEYYAELKRREIGESVLDGRKRIWSTRLFEFFFPDLNQPNGMKPPGRVAGQEERGREGLSPASKGGR